MQRREPLADRDGSSATKRALWHHTVISEGVQHFQKKMASREGIHSKIFQKRKGEVHVYREKNGDNKSPVLLIFNLPDNKIEKNNTVITKVFILIPLPRNLVLSGTNILTATKQLNK